LLLLPAPNDCGTVRIVNYPLFPATGYNPGRLKKKYFRNSMNEELDIS